jgi:hypothetical protein
MLSMLPQVQDILDFVKGMQLPLSTLPELQDTEQLQKVSVGLSLTIQISDSSASRPTGCVCLAIAFVCVQQDRKSEPCG